MSEKNITYAAIGIALIAIAISAYSTIDKPNMDGFVSISQHQLALDRVTELESVTYVSCDRNPDCVRSLSSEFAGIEQINRIISLVTAEADLMIQFQEKIVANSDKIADNHPYDFNPEEFPVESEVIAFSSLLAIQLEKPTWIQGEKIIFTGKALPQAGQVEATVTEPDGKIRHINAIVHKDGTYNFVFGTDFDSQLGEYTIFVEQQSRISQPISFTIISGE